MNQSFFQKGIYVFNHIFLHHNICFSVLTLLLFREVVEDNWWLESYCISLSKCWIKDIQHKKQTQLHQTVSVSVIIKNDTVLFLIIHNLSVNLFF